MAARYSLAGVLFLAALGAANLASAQPTANPEMANFARSAERAWLEAGRPVSLPQLSNAKRLPLISVKGNRFVDPAGKEVRLRGVSISDPDKLERQGHWSKTHFEKVKQFGANVVRIPVLPTAWRDRTPQKYLKLLEEAVEWCGDLDMYVIIDWCSDGTLSVEKFNGPKSYLPKPTQSVTYEFWRAVARRFVGNNTLAFYENFNSDPGHSEWSDLKRNNEKAIKLIRAYDAETILLVVGFDSAYDLKPLLEEPIDAEGIGYVVHLYESSAGILPNQNRKEDLGFAAAKYPLVSTEFRFMEGHWQTRTAEIGPEYSNFTNQIVSSLEASGFSWVAWCFDPEWGPKLLENWDYELTPSGEFFKQRITELNRGAK